MGEDTFTKKWNILGKYGAPCLGYPESVTVLYGAHLFSAALLNHSKMTVVSNSQLWFLTSDLLQYLIFLKACELHVMLID